MNICPFFGAGGKWRKINHAITGLRYGEEGLNFVHITTKPELYICAICTRVEPQDSSMYIHFLRISISKKFFSDKCSFFSHSDFNL